MYQDRIKWVYLIILSLVWGSSFILIKKGLLGLTPLQLGATRILIAGMVLIAIGFKHLKSIKKSEWKWVILSGFLGTLIPAFLIAFAETEIDSAVASILNSTTPLLALILGVLVFGVAFVKRQAIGVFIGLLGCLVLIFSGANVNPHQNYWFVGFVLVASVCYSINVNLIKQYMQNIHPIGITVGNFIGIMIPAFIVLMFSDFPFSEVTSNPKLYNALGYVVLLAIIGTCMAKVLFNKLVQMSSAIFATSVTYLIPIVALFWGVLDNEDFGFWQFVGMGIILFGVFLVNSGKKKV
ncbi:DMT family transporter [Croceibacter atlanticus]|uniref:DMT family transporter n=1 Tax=Croceibacter atlanticus TaxID=313588 RepID=UPI000C94921D|nr:permease [Croceibacter sp.]WSP35292.1 EamA family transporter [Croceibacter atlanticus]|tara:strand:- start:80 stop:964 length:885 start_codon:yes stop_codon:yes gene_type:complete